MVRRPESQSTAARIWYGRLSEIPAVRRECWKSVRPYAIGLVFNRAGRAGRLLPAPARRATRVDPLGGLRYQ